MILKTDKMRVDVDKVSFMFEENGMVVVNGVGVMLTDKDEFEALAKAYDWQHQTHTYDKNLKKVGGR
jgi:hypothetical protein